MTTPPGEKQGASLSDREKEARERIRSGRANMNDARFLAEAVDRLTAQLAEARQKQRTPGTIEICQNFRSASCGENEDHPNMGICGRKNCPRKVGSK